MTSTELYTEVASQARTALEKSVVAWKQGALTFTEKTDIATLLPKFDLASGVTRYFELLQQSLDAGRDYANKWVAIVDSLTEVVRDQAGAAGKMIKDVTESVSDLAVKQIEKTDES
jgi:hypothetical protein